MMDANLFNKSMMEKLTKLRDPKCLPKVEVRGLTRHEHEVLSLICEGGGDQSSVEPAQQVATGEPTCGRAMWADGRSRRSYPLVIALFKDEIKRGP